MATFEELVSIPFDNGSYRFCLDRVLREDQADRVEYAFVWRGSSRSPNDFIHAPAIFTFSELGRLMRKAVDQANIPDPQLQVLLMALLGRTQA